MSDETISKHEYERLLSESIRRKEKVRELTNRLAEVDGKLATIAADRDKHAADLTAMVADRDQYKTKLETQPDELRTQVSDLTNKLRTRTHRDKFDTLAPAHVNPAAKDAAWDLLQWKAEADEVDEAKMTAAITDLVGRHPVLKITTDDGGNGAGGATTTQQARAAGPGTSRGGQSTNNDPNAELAAKYGTSGRLA